MAKKIETHIADESSFIATDTLLKDKRTIVLNFNTQGNIGKTTETVGLIEVMKAMGSNPALISADPENKVMLNIYGTKDEYGALTDQKLGVGVVEIDMADKDGKLSDLLADPALDGRDVVVDTMGGSFNAFATLYSGLSDFYNAFPSDRFICLLPVADMKSFENLHRQAQVYRDLDSGTEIIMAFIFSKGKIGSIDNFKQISSAYNAFKSSLQLPTNIQTAELVFDTAWSTEEMNKFFKENKVRESIKHARGNTLILAQKFINERDKAWVDLLVSPDRKAELALMPHPTDSRNGRLWGKTLIGATWTL